MTGLRTVCCFLAIALLIGLGPAVLASPDEPIEGNEPLAEAGLDQTVQQNTTVHLDAGGSRAPDGEIVSYRWEIERPDGTATSPACARCERTSFRALETGEYRVTLILTDDDERTATDTMYVTVIEAEPPEVSLSGPEYVAVGDESTVRMDASAGDAPLSSVTWFVDGEQETATFVEGAEAIETIAIRATEEETLTVDARVTDENGATARARHEVTALDGSEFDVTLTGVADEYEAGDSVEPTVSVTNIGPIADTQRITLEDFDGTAVDSQRISLGPGEQTIISSSFTMPTLTWQTDTEDVGIGTVTACSETHCDGEATEIVDESNFQIDSLSVDDDESPLEVEASIVNTGETTGVQDVEYCVTCDRDIEWCPSCGDDLDVEDDYEGYLKLEDALTLDPGESETVSATWGGDWKNITDAVTIFVETEDDTETIAAKRELDEDDLEDINDGDPHPYFDVEFDLPNEIDEGESVDISPTVYVWPNNYEGRSTEVYSADEFGVVWQNQYTYSSDGDAYVSSYGWSVRGSKPGSVSICFADGVTEYTGAGGKWGSCETTTVVADDDDNSSDNPE